MMAERRIASIWWPRLSIERWARISGASADAAVALVVEAAHGQLIGAVTDAAAAAGARAGMRLTDARALFPALAAVAADTEGDAALVGRLARWAARWSPLVEIDGSDGLRLDVSGVAHLFGGEAGLIRDVEQRFAALGLSVRVAIAETAGAAWGLARFATGRRGPSQPLADAVAPLPVAALRLPAGPTRTLERLGLKTIGQLAGVPRRSLARRFREADNPLDALDRMLGRQPEPLTAAPCELPPRATLRLVEPVEDPLAGTQALELLVPELVRQLEERRLGARRLALTGYRVDASIAQASVATALASRDPAHLQRLLADKAATLDPGFGFDGFALEAEWCEPLGAVQDGLGGGAPPAVELARLVDRLSVKLGADRVRRPQPRASHLPERASGWRAALAEEQPCQPMPPQPPRPPRMLDMPEAIAVIYATPEGLPRRFIWRRGVHDITRAEGPERISPEWWREPAGTRLRDYYRVEDKVGRRFWIYREGVVGDGRGGAPLWFVHGLFG